MKTTEAFIDSNVALYLVSPEPSKAAVAERLIDGGGVISVQVLTEVTDVARRKFRMPWHVLHELLDGMKENLVVTPVSVSTHDLGLKLSERHHFRVYDAQLIAAALQAGCTTFWSEDLHNGQVIEGQLTIRNPFA